MAKTTTLLLLPGLDGTDIFFQPLLKALPAVVRPVVVTYPPSCNTYPELLAYIHRAVAGIPEYYVLGWSFSGPLALMLAAAEPDRVRGVILSASFVRPPHPLLRPLRFVLIEPLVWSWRLMRRLPLWLFRLPSDPLRSAKTQTWDIVTARTLAHRLRSVAGVDARTALRACRVPILYLAASDDRIVPRHNLDEIRRERPPVQVATIAGHHLAMYANPEPATAAIVRFIAEGGS